MKLSIVTTLFGSQPYVAEFHRKMKAAAEQARVDYEMIFVNDGSPDDALSEVLRLQKKDPRIVAIDLSRNFGHHPAILAGLSEARGEMVFLIDCDLEEEPEWLISFLRLFQSERCDVVYGVQARRKGGSWERLSGALFYWIFNRLSSVPLVPNVVTARLMSRRYVDALLSFGERKVFLAGLMQMTGYRQLPATVEKKSKPTSTYGLSLKITQFVDAITSFSDRPLIGIFFTGAFICLLSSIYILWLLWSWLWYGIPVLGWPSLIVSIWFLGGLTIFFIGVIGIYLSRIFVETKARPRTVVREIHRAASAGSEVGHE